MAMHDVYANESNFKPTKNLSLQASKVSPVCCFCLKINLNKIHNNLKYQNNKLNFNS